MVKKATTERLVAVGTMFIRLSRAFFAAHDDDTQNDCEQNSCYDPYNNGGIHRFFLIFVFWGLAVRLAMRSTELCIGMLTNS